MSLFTDGLDAYNNGQPSTDNPYDLNTDMDAYEEWYAGWLAGEDCEEEEE